jgi:acyl-CoA synthetase (NDP forming)
MAHGVEPRSLVEKGWWCGMAFGISWSKLGKKIKICYTLELNHSVYRRIALVTGQQIVGTARQEGRTLLTEIEAKELLKQAGVSVVETKLARSKDEAIAISRELGFPVVLKIASVDVVHKSDAGGVKLGLRTSQQVGKAFDDIMKSIKAQFPQAKIQGVSVQKMAREGTEVIIGMSKDAQFGPVIMFGLGGILVEILKDVSFRIVPLAKRDAREMIREIKGYPLLEGYRGREPVDVANLEDLILKVSSFVEQHPEIKELDLNPIFAYKDGAVAVDARVVLEAS